MMGLNLRKLAVGCLALGVLAGVFALYMHFNRTPPIVIEPVEAASQPVAEANDSDAVDRIGKIGDVGVGTVRQTEFIHRSDAGLIDRKFGFEELLHEQGNQWQITKPYMWMYLERFSCRVTADRGKVQLVEAFGRPMPTDAEFIGNVVIHVVPTDPNDPWECFILLDDVGFLAEKSMFSSTGAVRFLSRAVRLTGTGMELIYDGPRSRLEMFRVFDLDSLRMRSSEIKAMTDQGPEEATSGDQTRPATETDAGEIVSAAGATEVTPTLADPNVPSPDVYRCVFRRNVRLESPEGVVVVRDMLSINGIQRSRPPEPDAKTEPVADSNDVPSAPFPAPNALNTTASSYPVLSSIPDELYDVVVTCDGGAEITLVGGSPFLAEVLAARVQEDKPGEATPVQVDSSDRQQIVGQRIDFDFQTTDTTMLGPVAMKFFVDPNNLGGKTGQRPMPMEVTAQGAVRYLAAEERIVLEGGSTATLHTTEPNSNDEYGITSPRLTLDLAIDSNAPEDVNVNLRRLLADGGAEFPGGVDANGAPVVAVRMWRRSAGKVLGWGALDARELQYDANPDRIVATGPGQIWFHNAETIRSKTDPNRIVEPCYVRLTNFDTLKYNAASHQIIAADDSQQLLLDYFPLVEGGDSPQTRVVAGHVVATLQEIAKNRMDLVSFVASQGIEYDSESDQQNFIGAEMVYDRAGSLLTIRGDDQRPCYLNGALVDAIVVDLKTRKAKAEVRTPSIFEVRR